MKIIKKISLLTIALQFLICLLCGLNTVRAFTNPTENTRTPWIWIVSCVLWLICAILGILNYRKKYGKIRH